MTEHSANTHACRLVEWSAGVGRGCYTAVEEEEDTQPFTASRGWGSSENHPCPFVMSHPLSWPNGILKTQCLHAKVSRALTGARQQVQGSKWGTPPTLIISCMNEKPGGAHLPPPLSQPAITFKQILSDREGGAGRVLRWKREIARVRYATFAAANPRMISFYFPRPQTHTFKYTNRL